MGVRYKRETMGFMNTDYESGLEVVELCREFLMKDLGQIRSYIDMQIHVNQDDICVNQNDYITSMLLLFGMET